MIFDGGGRGGGGGPPNFVLAGGVQLKHGLFLWLHKLTPIELDSQVSPSFIFNHRIPPLGSLKATVII